MTTFLDLPPEVRLEVYRYLLLTRSTKFVAPLDNLAYHDLQPAILRTCGLINREARTILSRENGFVQIVHDSPLFEKEVSNFQISLLCKRHPQRMSRMRSLEVTITTQPNTSSEIYHIMIASEDLELMCTLLWILLGRGHMNVYLDFSKSVNAIRLSSNRQDELLLPFKTLFRASSITVKGAININIAAEVEDAPRKFTSMSAVELLELMQLLRREAQEYNKAGKYRRSIMCLAQALDISLNHKTIHGLRNPQSHGPWPGQSLWAALAIEYFRNTTGLSIMLKKGECWHPAYNKTLYALRVGFDLKRTWWDCPIHDEDMKNLERQKAELRVKLALNLPSADNT